jgi:hypothetical protein
MITGAMLILVTYTFGLSLISQAYPAGQATKTLSSTGSIQIQTTTGIGVYSDSGCTTELTSVPWGTLQPGGSQQVVCYIKNEGTAEATLSLTTDNWTPASTSTYVHLTWNYDEQPLSADEVVAVTLTLSVDSNIEGITTFGFDITIGGSS